MNENKMNIAVVGAGIAGLSAAWDLTQAGYTVTIYDRNDFPGGRMADVIVNGICTHSGASILFSFNKEMFDLVEELGLSDEVTSFGADFEMNCSDGSMEYPLRVTPSVPFMLAHKALGIGTKAKLTRLLPDIVKSGLMTDPCLMHTAKRFDDETMVDYITRVVSEEYLEKYLEPLFRAPWHWEPEDIGKAYVMSLMGHLVTSDQRTFKQGIGFLTRELASRLDVRLGTTVENVREIPEGGVTLRLSDNDGQRTINVDAVVMAIEGVYVTNVVEGLSQAETDFFDAVRYNPGARVYYGLKQRGEEDKRDWFTRSSPSKVSLFHVTDQDQIVPKGHVQPATIQAELIPELIAQIAEEGGQDRVESYIRDQIREYFPTIDEDVESIAEQWWDAMLPLWPMGYATKVADFLESQETSPKRILYCGDYLSQSHTGGACASGRGIARLLQRSVGEKAHEPSA